MPKSERNSENKVEWKHNYLNKKKPLLDWKNSSGKKPP